MKLYIISYNDAQTTKIKSLLRGEEVFTSDSYCFRNNSFVIDGVSSEERCSELAKSLVEAGVKVPMQ